MSIEERLDAAAREIGFGPALDFITEEDTPTTRMLRSILGSVALGLLEMGFEPPTT